MKKVDLTIAAIFIVVLAVIAIFWKCQLDPMVTVIAGVIALASLVVTVIQHKRIKALTQED